MSITTSAGTTVSIEAGTGGKRVILHHPEAPADMRPIEAGRLTHDDQGFQPAALFPGSLRPAVLRAIADLIEEEQK